MKTNKSTCEGYLALSIVIQNHFYIIIIYNLSISSVLNLQNRSILKLLQ